MADKTSPTDAAQGDGASADATPKATTKTAGKPAEAPNPAAAAEPAAQSVAASTTSVRPPAPADYKMPDDYASETAFDKVKAWAEANPGLAVLAAAGIGVIAGRILTGLVPDPTPPTLAERVESRAKSLQKEAKKKGKVVRKEATAFAGEAGDTISEALDRAAAAIREAADSAGDYAGEGVEKTKDLAETVSDAVKVAISGIVATKIDDWVDRVRK
jgi:ElaB/YqjD/DUF883 family membrane-anchored ribosome-binding protein